MLVTYKNDKLEQICTNASVAERKYNYAMAVKIQACMDVIEAADCVETLVNNRIKGCHRLKGKRRNQYSMHLVEPFRLVFSIIENTVEIALIEEIVDYH